MHVGEAFLQHAKQRQFHGLRRGGRDRRPICRSMRMSLRFVKIPPRTSESRTTSRTSSSSGGCNRYDMVRTSAGHWRAARAHPGAARCLRRRFQFPEREPGGHGDRHQILPDAVVEFARDAAALFVLRAHHALGKFLKARVRVLQAPAAFLGNMRGGDHLMDFRDDAGKRDRGHDGRERSDQFQVAREPVQRMPQHHHFHQMRGAARHDEQPERQKHPAERNFAARPPHQIHQRE